MSFIDKFLSFAYLEAVSDWPQKLIEAYVKDFGDDQ